jgi:acetyltransferase-like isoleucine patch superfamily enzyme
MQMNFRMVKELVKSLLYRPSGVSFGERSFIRRPYTIQGRRHIRFGSRTSVGERFHATAIEEYAGVRYHPVIEAGDDVYIGRSAYFTAIHKISIGDGCVLSDHVYITDESHGLDPHAGPIMLQQLVSKGPVIIGARCFLGYRVAIMPGVTLGEGCVVGANSTVTRSFPAYSMIAGSPARLIKTYRHDLRRWIQAEDQAESSV